MNSITKLFPLALVGALSLTVGIGCVGEIDDPGEGLDDEAQDGMIEEGTETETEALGDAMSTDESGGAEKLGEDDLNLADWCADVLNWDATWIEWENQVLTQVNQKRAAGATCGGVYKPPAPALTLDTRLRCAARKHSKDMGNTNTFSHTGSNGSTPWQRITNAGYTPYSAAAENIAAGYSSPTAAVNGWMSSSGHCANIMNANLKHLGTGYYYAGTSTYKHYWTQDFGKQ